MARPCTVCGLPAHARDPVVLQAASGQVSGRAAAAALGVPSSSFHRHMATCLPRQIAHQTAHAARQAGVMPSPVRSLPKTAEAAHGASSGHSRRRRDIMLDDVPAPTPDFASGSPAPTPAVPASSVSATVAPAPVPGLGADLQALRARAFAILDTAEASGDPKTALAAIREARGTLEALAKVEDRIAAQGAATPLHMAPEWLRTRTAMLTALAVFPEARIAVADALAELGGAP